MDGFTTLVIVLVFIITGIALYLGIKARMKFMNTVKYVAYYLLKNEDFRSALTAVLLEEVRKAASRRLKEVSGDAVEDEVRKVVDEVLASLGSEVGRQDKEEVRK